MRTARLGGGARWLVPVACAAGLATPAAVAAPHLRPVQVTSNVGGVRLFVGGGTVYFEPSPALDAAFAAALRRHVREANIVIDGADIRTATGPLHDDDEFTMTVIYATHYGSTLYRLTAKSPHDYPTIEHDFRKELPAYLDACARQFAAKLKEHPP